MHRTRSSWPSSSRRQAPNSISHIRIVLSEEPLTTWLPRYCKHAIPLLWPWRVRTNSLVDVRHTYVIGRKPELNCMGSMGELYHTLIVLSPEAETMYRSSKSTTLTAALCPTSTRRSTMSFGLFMSHTAIVRSYMWVWWKSYTYKTPCNKHSRMSIPLSKWPWSCYRTLSEGQPHNDAPECWAWHQWTLPTPYTHTHHYDTVYNNIQVKTTQDYIQIHTMVILSG